MKKLLILAYDFPPYVSVGGLRPYNWYKYLKEYGVEPVVITRQWQNKHGNHLDYIEAGYSDEVIVETTEFGTIVRTPYRPNLSNTVLLKYGAHRFRLLRKSITAFYEIAQFIFPVGPKAAIYKAAKHYLKSNEVDAIIATGDPFVLFAYASKLSSTFNTPWIADYRDPWSQNFSSKKKSFQRTFDKWFELYYVKSAQHILTVDVLFQHKIHTLFPDKMPALISNGFDPEGISEVENIEQSHEILTFSFIGTIYEWHPLMPLLAVFNKIASEQHFDFRIKFYGTNLNELLGKVVSEKFTALQNKMVILPKLPNTELLRELKKDNVLLLFNYYEFTGTKIYDYVALKRKILLCFDNDVEANRLKDKYYFKHIEIDENPQRTIIERTNSGVIVKDSSHLEELINDLWQEFSQTGDIRCDSVGIENYSRKIQVEKLAEIIQEIDALKSDEQKG
ncbi:MAG: hypothetical protein RIT43_1593 [Bacteroidota bacterium]|jgi:hypothetical protein